MTRRGEVAQSARWQEGVPLTFTIAALTILAVSCGATAVATPALARLYAARGRVDRPGGRKRQAVPIPYGAGLATFLGIAVPMSIGIGMAALERVGIDALPAEIAVHAAGLRERAPLALAILLGAASLLVMGRIDDRRGLPIWVRLTWQAAAAAIAVAAGMRATLFLHSEAAQFVLTVLWCVFVTNCFNFIDNMDGLLPGVAACCAAGVAVVAALDGQLFVAALALSICGSMLGVYLHNRHPARVYLGDEGSMFVGFLLASSTIVATYQHGGGFTWRPVVMPVLILLVPLADGVFVVSRRLGRGHSPFRAGRDHISHRLARSLGDRAAVATLIGTESIAVAAAAALSTGALPHRLGWAAAFLAAAFTVLARARRLARTAPSNSEGPARDPA